MRVPRALEWPHVVRAAAARPQGQASLWPLCVSGSHVLVVSETDRVHDESKRLRAARAGSSDPMIHAGSNSASSGMTAVTNKGSRTYSNTAC